MGVNGADGRKVSNRHKILTSTVAGGIAGAVAKTTIAPFDRTKINFQVSDKAFSTRAALRFLVKTFREDGVTSLWRGNTANLVRIIPYAAIQYASHEQWKILLSSGNEQHLPPGRRFTAGALAGVTSVSATYPLDLVRARMAVTKKHMYHTVFETIVKIWKNEGAATLYRGYVPTVLGSIPYVGTSFFVYETLKKMHQEHCEGPIHPLHRMGYGAIAGACGQSLTYPLDIVRRRMQTSAVIKGRAGSYKTILGTLKHVYLEEGLRRGLFKGLSLNWIKGPIAVGTSFMTFETMQQFLRRLAVFHE